MASTRDQYRDEWSLTSSSMILSLGLSAHGKFVDDAMLCGATEMPEGPDAIQRDLDRLRQWAQVNLMKFNKSKFRDLHVVCSNPCYQYKLGGCKDGVQLC